MTPFSSPSLFQMALLELPLVLALQDSAHPHADKWPREEGLSGHLLSFYLSLPFKAATVNIGEQAGTTPFADAYPDWGATAGIRVAEWATLNREHFMTNPIKDLLYLVLCSRILLWKHDVKSQQAIQLRFFCLLRELYYNENIDGKYRWLTAVFTRVHFGDRKRGFLENTSGQFDGLRFPQIQSFQS